MTPPPAHAGLALRQVPGGVLLKVHVTPGASRDRFAGIHGDALKLAVTAPPEKGKANEAVAGLLARALGLRASAVALYSGGTARDKWFRIDGLTGDEAGEAILAALAAPGRQKGSRT